ncbi:hypothetical protein NGB36_12690 [Streptomyces sp. RB6PN25]|uniref:Secreted protein n=1 Tax=Streptomyces humicola TaxID=2953240 RepID=A0ABT1PUS9_9ACTN|nr:hypothetical protein [Streptomyces humicola]MCQ4081433.1 hypothetical protein [Streptomyces humicola]
MTVFRFTAAALLTATALAAGAASPALADAPHPTPVPFTASQTARARDAAGAPATLAVLSRFFAHEGGTAATTAAPRLSGPTVTVFSLDPGFVAGRADAPVADPQFLATAAVCADGRAASVWTAWTGGGWKVVNIASGADETTEAAAAHGDGTVFHEPQTDGWYVLRGGRVLPLNADARHEVGAGGVALAAYQRLVHRRYGDKLPGSAYDTSGEGGGYDGQAAPRPAAVAASAPGTTAGSARTAVEIGGGAAAAAAGAAALLAARARRRG